MTAAGTIEIKHDLERNDSIALAKAAEQTTTLFTSVAQGITAVLNTGGAVAEATEGNRDLFAHTVEPRLAQSILANAVLFEISGSRIREVTSVGMSRPVLVRRFGAAERRLLRQAARSGRLWIVARGPSLSSPVLGVASGARPGSRYAVYAEISIPNAIAFGNSEGFDFAFYLGKETPAALFTTNTTNLPIRGHRLVQRPPLSGLGQEPLLVFGDPSISALSRTGPWIFLAAGMLISLALAIQFEAMRRRRDIALRLVVDLESKNAELDLQSAVNRHQALHDALTGLPNRALFQERIEQAIVHGRRTGEVAAVMLIDLDRFKDVNDTLGHQSGDELLQALGARLGSMLRESDTVARLGGDEFGVLARSLTAADDALALAHEIREGLATAVTMAHLEIEVDASIGIALSPEHGHTVESLMRHADVALYRSKELHVPIAYAKEHDHFSPVRLQLITGLRGAIENGEIVVYYQPQASTQTGEIESVEALVRWNHPQHGLIEPDQFIPLAEHTGAIRPLTKHVLETAVKQCRDWLDRGWNIRVAVNVSARDLLDAGFPDEVIGCLASAGVDPHMLALEITEDTILADAVRALAVIERLTEHGVRFAIDDFGVGHSSLSYLKRLPIQVLKIDKSFVLGMAENPDDAVIVRSTIDLGHNLQLTVVAEGVATDEIRGQLEALHCDVIQGYVLCRPLPAAEVERLFRPPQAEVASMARHPVPSPA